jgi:hypothetical protein
MITVDNYQQILTNFQIKELATSNGEFNMDIRFLLAMQACRSWMGVKWLFAEGGGCRLPKYKRSKASTHHMEMFDREFRLGIPATGCDPYNPDLDTWEFMDKVEYWCDAMVALVVGNAPIDYEDAWEEHRWLTAIKRPIFSGRGCYPDTKPKKNDIGTVIHLDSGHLSMNPEIRRKRTNSNGSIKVVRWCRWKGKYHYAAEGETFAELRGRLGL